MGLLKTKGLAKRERIASITYFDILEGLVALTMASTSLILPVANLPGALWNHKDALGLGLLLCTSLAFILLRRRLSPQRMPWLHVCIAASTVVAGIVLFRRWSGIWLGVGVLVLLFSLCLRPQTISEGFGREDSHRVLLIVGGLLFPVIMAEGTLRLFPDLLSARARAHALWRAATYHSWHVAHPYIGHLHNLDYFLLDARTRAKMPGPWSKPSKSDAWGFRNTEPWPERVDMIALGDSMTYSLAVHDQEAWPVLLERALAPQRVLNLGLIGAAPQQYLRVYETFGAKLSPKVLLVGLFLWNDLGGALEFDSWRTAQSHEDFMTFSMKEDRSGVIERLLQKLYLHTLVTDIRAAYRSGSYSPERTVQLTDGGRVLLLQRTLAKAASKSSSSEPAFALVLKTLEGLQALATQAQIHCLVLFIPSKEEVYLPLMGEAAADLAAPFLPELDKRGIAYLDLGPHFRQRAASGETLFEELDSHANARGYGVMAEAVLAYLRDHRVRHGLN